MPMLIYSKDMFSSSDSFFFKNELHCESGCTSPRTADESCLNETTVIAEKDSVGGLVDLTAATSQDENGSVSPARKRPCFNRTNSEAEDTSNLARRIVCNARGLSKDHNCDTAFFEIPPDAPHGLLLICSHQECIRAGVRFRYCKVCAMPAARRNFFIRHGHGLFQTSQELNRTVDNVFGVAHHYMPDNYESASCTVPQHATSSAGSDGNRKDDEKYQDHMGIARVSNSISSSRSSSTTTGSNPRLVESGRKTLNSKEQAWLQLLHDRPARSDQVGMAHWTAKILHLSLPDNPISSMPQMQHDNSISTLWQGGGGNGFRSSTTRTVNMYEIAGQQHQDSELHGLFDGFVNISNFFD